MAAVTWCLAFPYSPNEPIREAAWAVVSAFYTKHFPDVPQLVHSATPVGERFLRARTRNDLVRMAQDFDVVCLIDADTLIHPSGIRRMVAATAEDDTLVGKPFRRGVNLTLDGQRRLSNDHGHAWPAGRFADPGAAWVMRPGTWWAAGGMDERFTGWGGEDNSFLYMHAAVGGSTASDKLPAVKTAHEQLRWSADPGWVDTYKREAVYHHVWQHPELAREWLNARYEPGTVDDWIDRHGIGPYITARLEAQSRKQAQRELRTHSLLTSR